MWPLRTGHEPRTSQGGCIARRAKALDDALVVAESLGTLEPMSADYTEETV